MWLLSKCTEFKSEKELAQADDTKILEDMGYTQELFRGVTGWFMNFAFTFTAVSIISSYSISFSTALTNGGPAVMVWGWIIGSMFTICIGLSMAEICSTYPSAGSVYHWAGMLANEEWSPFFSYITGWFNFLGNAAGDAVFASGFAGMVASAAEYSDVSLDVGPQVGIAIATITVWCLINIMRIDQQGWVNNFAAIYQVLSSIVIIIVVLCSTKIRASGSFVFTEYYNGTGLENNDGYVVLIGLLTTLFAFSGYEAGGHIAEETQNSRKSAPRGIVACCVTGAVLGIVYILGLLFAIPDDVDTVLNGYPPPPTLSPNDTCYNFANLSLNANYSDPNCSSPDGGDFALTNLFNMSIGPTGGLGLIILIVINVFLAGISSVTVTSRIAFAMARDRGLPFSHWLHNINEQTKSPIRTVFVIWGFDTILLLLQLASTTAFEAIVALCTIGFQISYSIPIWLRVTHARNTFQQGAFNLGRFSILCGWISALWLTFTSLLFFWPFEYPVTAETMNYTVVVVGAVAIASITFWIISGRKWFKGPRGAMAAAGILPDKAQEKGDDDDEKIGD